MASLTSMLVVFVLYLSQFLLYSYKIGITVKICIEHLENGIC